MGHSFFFWGGGVRMEGAAPRGAAERGCSRMSCAVLLPPGLIAGLAALRLCQGGPALSKAMSCTGGVLELCRLGAAAPKPSPAPMGGPDAASKRSVPTATRGSCSLILHCHPTQGRGVLQTFRARGKKGKKATSSGAGLASCCTSQGPGFAGWSAKHFPVLGAKSYK